MFKKYFGRTVIPAAASLLLLAMPSCSMSSGGGGGDDDSYVTPSSTPSSSKSSNPSGAIPSGNTSQYGNGDVSEGVFTAPTAADVSNASVKIVKSEGWLNSAYIIFEQVEGAAYKVLADDVEIDAPLIRYYDTYVYNTYDEATSTWTEQTLTNVVRADALGLKAGSHTMKVCAVGTENTSDYSSATMTVADHDRSGFAFTGSTTPGAYNMDGTLKNGAVVIYLTQGNKKTLTATIGGKSYTGIQDITQAIKKKNTGSTPIDIRIIGQVTAESNDLSCADMKSAYALGVKEASNVTIEGVGHDATLKGAGVAAFQSEYIEVANLGLVKWGGGHDGDGVSIKASGYVWVHNNDYFYGDAGGDKDQVKGDGSMDMKDDSNHVTISYNHFYDSGKMSLCGMKSESGPNYITFHHNWFDHSDSRHPRIRTMTVHVYNNYFDGNAKYGVGVTTGANCFVEGNYFRNAHDPMMSSMQGTDALGGGTFSGEKGGVIKSWNNKFAENNTNGVKFQFITNKWDYTNDKELGEYKEWYETVGTDNGDGTWTIYDEKVTNTEDGFASNSLIGVDEATKKGAYYQASKGKTAFGLCVPANVLKVIVTAKCGSSTSGATTKMTLKGVSSDSVGNTEYAEYTFDITGVTSDDTLELVNSGSNSLNIREIKVIASSGWKTKLTSGADLSNIDAYEVDARNQLVPESVKARSGGATYSNFDQKMGDSGLGLNVAPTDPDKAKKIVIGYSGRHNPDIMWNFNNAVDDASYEVNTQLNAMLVAYSGKMLKIQGNAASSPANPGVTPENPDDPTPEPTPTPSEPVTVPEGTITVTFDSFTSGTSTINGVTVMANLLAAKNTTPTVYNGVTYNSAIKMEGETKTKITFTLEKASTITVVTDTASKKIKFDGEKIVTDAEGIAAKDLEVGDHTILKSDSMNVYAIIITPKS